MAVKKVNKGYWTKEKCSEVALMFTTKKTFQKEYKTAYKKSMENKWLKDICSHMNSADMWNHYDANKDVWKLASKVHEKWVSSNMCGSKKLSRSMGYDSDLLTTIVKYFKKGWVPEKDEKWTAWAKLV
jgi:hypothetical protein